jgi:multicomponent Na+:H+ antiporter subunit E
VSSPIRVLLLVVLWILAWGELSLANVLSGVVVAGVLLAAFPAAGDGRASVRVRPVPALRLVGYVLRQLVTSNILVTRVILSPRSKVTFGVLAYPVRYPSDALLTLMANVIGLTPGTMTVEATREPAVLYVHVLLLHDRDEARGTIAHLEELAIAALGLPDPHPDPLPDAARRDPAAEGGS